MLCDNNCIVEKGCRRTWNFTVIEALTEKKTSERRSERREKGAL